jgi:phosphate starvation-inducible PhoH-like protein
MRGRTLDNAFVILDEAQNTTHQMKKASAKSAKFMITGDPVDFTKNHIQKKLCWF